MAATHHRHGSRTLPRRPCTHADPTTPAEEDGFSGRLLRRPPTAFPLWQEGRLQRETFEACSGFTCLSACALAPWLRQGLPRRLQPGDCSPRLLQWLPGRTDNSPDGTCTRWSSRPRRSLRNLKSAHVRPPSVPHCHPTALGRSPEVTHLCSVEVTHSRIREGVSWQSCSGSAGSTSSQ